MIESDRIVTASASEAEEKQDWAIRPQTFDEYCGQNEVSEQMRLFIKAALGRDESLDHTLIFGPPGLGKTTLANIVANEMGVDIRATSGPVIEKKGDLVAALTNLEEGDVLFIDEIHTIVGAGGATGSLDASNMFKPALARGEIQCIGPNAVAL